MLWLSWIFSSFAASVNIFDVSYLIALLHPSFLRQSLLHDLFSQETVRTGIPHWLSTSGTVVVSFIDFEPFQNAITMKDMMTRGAKDSVFAYPWKKKNKEEERVV